jgi:phosphoesterase RecJ-like protein
MSPAKKAAQVLAASSRVAVGCHVNPDADTVGSALALTWALLDLGKHVEPLCPDPLPANLLFLPGAELIRGAPPGGAFDLGVLVDLEGLDRVARLAPFFEALPHLLTIDHHRPHQEVGDVRFINMRAASTAELVYRVLRAMAVPLDERIATCLLAGLVTDTGGFRFPNTRPQHLALAARLMRAGADISRIAEEVYENRSLAAQRLLGRALSGLQQTKDGHTVWAAISYKDFQETGSLDADTDGIVNHVRAVANAEVGLLFRETRPGRVRVSLRSRGRVDVAHVAQALGGGGHKNASGCSFNTSLEEAVRTTLAEVGKSTDSLP